MIVCFESEVDKLEMEKFVLDEKVVLCGIVVRDYDVIF